MNDSYVGRHSASTEHSSSAGADTVPCSQNCRRSPPTHFGGKDHSDSKNWPPVLISSGEPLTRTSILQTPVYLGAAKFAAHAYRRPWKDTSMYLVYEGSTETAPPTFLLLNEKLVLFEQFYPPQPGLDLVDSNYWICGRGAEPGTTTFAKWIHDAAPQLMYAGTSGTPFPSPSSTSVKEYFIRISTLCKEGLNDPYGINRLDLYENLLTPLNVKNPSLRTVQDQIADIIEVLQSSNLLDLSLCRNQILAQLLYEGHDTSWFMLLMSLHLYLRLEEIIPEDRSLWLNMLRVVSPKVAHYLMFAQVWIANCIMSLDQNSDLEEATMFYNFVVPRSNQIDSLKEFARAIKWPDLERIEQLPRTFKAVLDEIDFRRGSWTETWVRGLVLPGPISSFLLLGSLLDLSVEMNADQHLSSELESSLIGLEHGVANFGLFVHGSSYWHSNCIVGKVLGPQPDVWQVGDWICGIKLRTHSSGHPFIRVFQIPTQHTIQELDIEKLADRSNPAGDSKAIYSTKEFNIPVTPFDTNLDHVQFLSVRFTDCCDEQDSTLHYAHLRFLIDGYRCYRPLRYNVDFVEACTCHSGPHPLHKSYPYKAVKAKRLIRLNAWGHANVDDDYDADPNTLPESTIEKIPERVLVITASHADEEVFARAWCSNLGLSAVVGNLTNNNNCSACMIRQAFISHISVIILTCKPSTESEGYENESDWGTTPPSNGSEKQRFASFANESGSFSSKVTGESFHEVSLDAADLIASGGKNIKISFKAQQPSPTGSRSNSGTPFVVNLTLNVTNSESSIPSPVQNNLPTRQPTVEDCTDEEDEVEPQIHTPVTEQRETSEERNPSTDRASHRSRHVNNRSQSTPPPRAEPTTTTIPSASASASFPSPTNATCNHTDESAVPNSNTEQSEHPVETTRPRHHHREHRHERHRERQTDRDNNNNEPQRAARHSRPAARREPVMRRPAHSRRNGTRPDDGRRAAGKLYFVRPKEAKKPVPEKSVPEKPVPAWLSTLRGMFLGKSDGGSPRKGNSGKSIVKEVRRPRRGEVEFVLR